MAPIATYRIEVIHKDRHAWAAEPRQAVGAEPIHAVLHRTVDVIVSESPTRNKSLTNATYLGSTESAADTSIHKRDAKATD